VIAGEEECVSKRLNEFTRYLNEFGARAFDQLAAGRAAAGMNGTAEGVSSDVSPLDGLAAHWSVLSAEEKARFVRQATAARTARPRARRTSAAAPKRASATSPLVPALTDATSSPDAEKKRRKAEKKAKKQAKKDAKAQAKLEKKLKKKLQKKASLKNKPEVSGAKTAKKNAPANGASASKKSGKPA
jgi:hypothetical protein